jgi:hypothetical protein
MLVCLKKCAICNKRLNPRNKPKFIGPCGDGDALLLKDNYYFIINMGYFGNAKSICNAEMPMYINQLGLRFGKWNVDIGRGNEGW